MKWLLLAAGLALAFIGSAGAAALVTTARIALAEAISRRLRGTRESLGWVTDTEREVVAATAAASFGAALVGVALPGLLTRATPLEFALVLVLVGVPLTLLGGYLLPRWLTVPRAGRVVEQLAPVVRGWTAMLGIVLPSRNPDTDEHLRALVREGTVSGFGSEELVLVGGVMNFARRPVREVMTPRTSVVAVSRDTTVRDIEALLAESGYTRLPVYGSSLDEILGMVHAFDLFKYRDGEPLPLRPVSVAPATQAAADVLLDMQRERRHLAVVVDEFGGTAGIVTLEDLLVALVGEIADEDDTAVVSRPPEGDVLDVDGSVACDVVAAHFSVELPGATAVSFAGLVAELAGRIPIAGERFTLRGLEVDIVQASPTRVERMLVRRAGPVIPLDAAK